MKTTNSQNQIIWIGGKYNCSQ